MILVGRNEKEKVQNLFCLVQVQHEAEILFSLVEGKRVVTMFDYYEKREHSLLVLEYLQVRNA